MDEEGPVTRIASSTAALLAAAIPFMTFEAPSTAPIAPLMALMGSLPARIVSSTVSVILARIPVGALRAAYRLSRYSTKSRIW